MRLGILGLEAFVSVELCVSSLQRSDVLHSAPIGSEYSVSVLLLFHDKSHLPRSDSRHVLPWRFSTFSLSVNWNVVTQLL